MSGKRRTGLDKGALAEHYGVTPHAVRVWMRKGLPARRKRGPKNRKLFDIVRVDRWLAAHGVVPRAMGARAKATVAEAEAPAPSQRDTPDTPVVGELGLAGAVVRTREMELALSGTIQQLLQTTGNEQTVLAKLQLYVKIMDQLRKAEHNLIDLQVKRGGLVERVDLLETLKHLASVFRAGLERLPEEMCPQVVTGMAAGGQEIADLAGFQAVLHQEVQAGLDRTLKALSEDVRKTAGRLMGSGGKGG